MASVIMGAPGVVGALLRVGVAEGDRAEVSAFFFWPALLGVAFFAVRAILGESRGEESAQPLPAFFSLA